MSRALFGVSQAWGAEQRSVALGDLATGWESLNPGYWRVYQGKLRRNFEMVGARARQTGFPFHYESATNPNGRMTRKYDPSLPMGIIWNRHWKLSGDYTLRVEFEVKGLRQKPREGDDPNWKTRQPGYGLCGLAFGGETQFESFRPTPDASPIFAIRDDGAFGIWRHTGPGLTPVGFGSEGRRRALATGDRVTMVLSVASGQVKASVSVNGGSADVTTWATRPGATDGYIGIAARGDLDVEVSRLVITPEKNTPLNAPLNDCHVCYALGDTLTKTEKGWRARFVGLFRTPGANAEIRIADTPEPDGGWGAVPAAGSAGVKSNSFRQNTAVIDALLPGDPSKTVHYFTVWKDGVDVTGDPRLGTDSVGPGTGLVGGVPVSGAYVGRLPRLTSPYRICGLSCHAIHTASGIEGAKRREEALAKRASDFFKPDRRGVAGASFVHDQPCDGAFQHIEAFDYQIMLWEDDVWYLELLFYPPSTEDAYKVITTTIAGPTTRWQMMRHWNVLNPGDHDYGMDDVKGPEQLLIRRRGDLGQDPEYMARNFQIVSHLMTGSETPSGTDNPKRWRKWKLPDRDFTLLIMDSRLWRSSQDTAIWDDEGWDHDPTLYRRSDPTRALLGEEQFAWLSNELKTDSSPLICLTGLNGLHTIWSGHDGKGWTGDVRERDRVSADYAGWVKAGADRILELMSARSGVVSIYGDVHAGSIIRNTELRLFECSFGPIGRWGGRKPRNGFGRTMTDHDGRPLELITLYHHQFRDADLAPQTELNYWNVLDAEFNAAAPDPVITLKLRNIKDPPSATPRGGGWVQTRASETGRKPTAALPDLRTLPGAEVLILTRDGAPLLGARSLSDGAVQITGVAGVEPGQDVIVLATRDEETRSDIVRLQQIASKSQASE